MNTLRGAAYGLAAAVLFGLSAPVSRLLLAEVTPVLLAALLYLGGGAAVAAWSGLRRLIAREEPRAEAPLQKRDLPVLGAIILTGGMLGPWLMLLGLQRVSGVTGALMLNLEGPFTALLAVVAFREHLGWRGTLAAALIFGGAALLGFSPGPLTADPLGVLLLAGACLSWAVDNNLTQRLSLRDPLALVRAKCLGAGTAMLVVAALWGEPLRPQDSWGWALLLGAGSYGWSIVLDAYALRWLGAAREAAFFSTAPFIGAVAAVPVLGDVWGAPQLTAAGGMAIGVVLLLRERHSHLHAHSAMEHEHLHVHDEHHQHPHSGPVTEPHSHLHRHEPITHEHPHVSDAHHRHGHRHDE